MISGQCAESRPMQLRSKRKLSTLPIRPLRHASSSLRMPVTRKEESHKPELSTSSRKLKEPVPTQRVRSIKKKKGRKPKPKPDIFEITRYISKDALTQRDAIIEALYQSRHLDTPQLYLTSHSPSQSRKRSKDRKESVSKRPLIPPCLSPKSTPMDTPAALHHSITNHLSSHHLSFPLPLRSAQGFLRQPLVSSTNAENGSGLLVQRPSRHIDRPDYCALGNYNLTESASDGIRKKAPPSPEQPMAPIFEPECEPEVMLLRQRGRPRKGEEGVRRHAILQIKYTDGVENVKKNSEVQMILDRVYGRESKDEEEDYNIALEEEKETALFQKQTPIGTNSKWEQPLRKRAAPSVRTEFHPSNMVLGIARVNMDNWMTQAQIETPQFRLIREVPVSQSEEENEGQATEDEAYVSLHLTQEEKEIAARKSKQRKRRIIRGKGAFKTPKRRGRPPRNKRKRKSQFAQTRSTLPQLSSYSLSEENQGQIDQTLFYDHYAPIYNEELFNQEGEYESGEDGELQEHDEELQEPAQIHEEDEEEELPMNGLLHPSAGRLEDLQHSLEPRRRASSLSSNGLGSPIFPPSSLLEAWP